MPRAIEHQHHTGFFVRGPSPAARLLLFSLLSLVLLATDAKLNYLTEVRQGFLALAHPLQLIANAPRNLIQNVGAYFHTQTSVVHENSVLRSQALKHAAELQRYKTLEVENERLRKLLGAAQLSSQPARLAEILHMGRDPFTHKVVVNLGSRQNIVAGQAVIDEVAIIGQVTRVYPFSSEVTLITDKGLSVPVLVERNGLRAIAFGRGHDAMIELPSLPTNVDIRVGDKLITSGIDGIYPTGLAVAEVTHVDTNTDTPFAHIIAKPLAGIENHKQLLLVSIPKVDRPADSNTLQNPDPQQNVASPRNKKAVTPKRHGNN
ncbi:rod shape-determining protein MreC [Methylobacillus rhizosphaerae]|uniref:Cell shape-determining protein MreC n=1 Tax=Methylobacillus rhizosphaerae TaxID=551994 RepID=A0A238XSY2_9PROT|nr:rod shape-determining protein MreC [Methylobacillus rhizosphaerae]SNR61444.1 rod shape-determining protein MreC [Methylobacillus rhizosphaerae]